jgi:hypothetical protein
MRELRLWERFLNVSGEIKIGLRSSGLGRGALAVSLAFILAAPLPARAQQNGLTPTVAHGPHELQFDWPAIEISSATYEAGPTGLTLFHFPHRVMAVVDVRGGGPGTVNTDMLRLG